MIIVVAIILMFTLLGILIFLLCRNGRVKTSHDQFIQEAYIYDLQGKTDRRKHRLGTKPTLFGRIVGEETTVLDYIIVNESTVGRRHALIKFRDHAYWIIDQASINGTFVNSEPVNGEVRLKHGDRIRIHQFNFEFIIPKMEEGSITMISNKISGANSL